jgi:hypothetical protein
MSEFINQFIRGFLRKLGYVRFEHWEENGKHCLRIDGKLIAQSSESDVWMKDEEIHRMGWALLDECEWEDPELPRYYQIRR